MADNPYLAIQRFPGDGVTLVWEISLAGNQPDAASGTRPYLEVADIKAYEVTPATAETAESRIELVITEEGPNTFSIPAPIPVGKVLLFERGSEDRFSVVNFQSLQAVSEFDLDQANRQLLFLAQEATDRSRLAQEAAAEVRDVAQAASELAFSTIAAAAAAQAAADAAAADAAAAANDADAAAILAAQAAADAAAALAAVEEAGVQSFNGRSGFVVAASGDYTAEQVTRGAGTVESSLVAVEAAAAAAQADATQALADAAVAQGVADTAVQTVAVGTGLAVERVGDDVTITAPDLLAADAANAAASAALDLRVDDLEAHEPFVVTAAAAGTAVDFTGIPSWATKLTVMWRDLSTNGTSVLQVRVGDGAIVSTGYVGQAWSGSGGFGSNTTGASLGGTASAANILQGTMVFSRVADSSVWVWALSNAVSQATSTGSVGSGHTPTLAGLLDRIRITMVNGTDVFDSGTFDLLVE